MNKNILVAVLLALVLSTGVAVAQAATLARAGTPVTTLKYANPSWVATPIEKCVLKAYDFDQDGVVDKTNYGVKGTKMDGTPICYAPHRGKQRIIPLV